MDKLRKARQYYNEHLNNSMVHELVLAFLLELILETLGRQQLPGLGGLLWMVQHPLVFFYNVLIIFATLCIGSLFKRRMFVTGLITFVWMLIGVANGVILTQRMTPFTMKDLSAMTEGATILTNYMAMWQIIMIGVVILLVVIGFVILFIKGPKHKEAIKFKRNLVVCLLIIACAFGSTYGLIRVNVLSTFFGNLAYAYRDYGVPYCFINTWLNQGISKPAGYSQEEVSAIVKKSGISKSGVVKRSEKDIAVSEDKPNIIFLQLESFVDPTKFKDIKLSQPATPNFRQLARHYSTGNLTVPACGAGTANTEFEVMTGISVKFFGPGEYPFKSVLTDRTAESVASDLTDIGYSAHAIHNHRALFYNRNEVFDNIGYNSFTSVEYMSGVEYTPKNWAKDKILTSQILETMKSSKTRDYIYTISVQGHGKYPTEPMLVNPKIQVTSAANEETKNKYEYYVNQVFEMDQFVKELTDTLKTYEEPVILVMYGDHIPALDITEESYDAKDLYQTQYVIWSNYGLKKKDKDLTTYQLAANVLGRAGIHSGSIVRYHQKVKASATDYLKDLKVLGYDMFYGEDYMYGGTNPFQKAGMRMGVKDIKIYRVVNVGGKYYIQGQNFTEQSKVTLGDKVLHTVYLSPDLLGLEEEVDEEDASSMKVSQIDKSNDTIISTTE
ncbi:MAG: LTA synthase family protein [Eubacterium sp.]|nr:LTA synthase family protein [Eubacterium sp.]